MEDQQRSPKLLLLVITTVLIVVIVGGCVFIAYLLGANNGNNSQEVMKKLSLLSPIPSQPSLQTETTSAVSDKWTIYTDVDFSITYPTSWLVKKGFSTKEDVVIYDPSTIQSVTQNGSQSRLPTHFVDILSVTASTQSAKQLVDNYAKQASDSAVTSEESTVLGENQVLVHTKNEPYNSILWSQNGLVAQFSSSIQHVRETSTENKILQSFQFSKH